jgi:hypothetical protein
MTIEPSLDYTSPDGIFQVIEGGNGFYLYYKQKDGSEDCTGMGDGVDFFSSEEGESISPGTPAFTAAMVNMLDTDGRTLVAAYFPQYTDDYEQRARRRAFNEETDRLRADLRYWIHQSRSEPEVVAHALCDALMPYLSIQALRTISKKMKQVREELG